MVKQSKPKTFLNLCTNLLLLHLDNREATAEWEATTERDEPSMGLSDLAGPRGAIKKF